MPRSRLLLLLPLVLALAPRVYPAPPGSAPVNQTGSVAPARPAPRDDILAYLEGLPETNPYRATLLRLHALPAEDREALTSWTDASQDAAVPAPALTSARQALTREFSSALVALARQPPTRAEDWPILRSPDDPENPAAMMLPGVSLVRQLTRMAVKTGDTLPPDEAFAIYAAAAQLGRQQRAGGTLIEQLTGVAVEGIAFSAVGRRLSEFSPAELQSLSAAWAALHPSPSIAQTFAGERDRFFTPIVNDILRPGLIALLAEADASDGQLADLDSTEDPDVGFTRHLRLSGLVDLGDSERRISLEDTRTHTSFTITEGKSTDGITLVSLDFETNQAVIRRGTCEAIIHLESKRIVERRDERHAAIERFRLCLGFGLPSGASEDKGAAERLKAILVRVRRHPRGADGYADDLLSAYQENLTAQLAAAASPDAPPPDAADSVPPPSDDPFLKLIVPSFRTFGNAARTLTNAATVPTVLQASIHHRLAQLGAGSPDAGPADPWMPNGAPFTFTAIPDGGFTLRTRYEVKHGQPATYKFSAPDAGFVRAK